MWVGWGRPYNTGVEENKCPKCGSDLGEVVETAGGKKLQRCTNCTHVKWLPVEPKILDEKCPKCGNPLVLAFTRFGKKMKKCSTGGWDAKEKKATGCDYIEWINGTTEPLDKDCPKCGNKLVLYTTVAGKRMIKCSTSGWDREKKQATGCDYIQWLRFDEPVDET